MKNEIFFVDFFIRQLVGASDEVKESIQNSIMLWAGNYTSNINYDVLDDQDARNLFENVKFIISFYTYKNDIDVMDKVFDMYSFIESSYKFFKDTLSGLKERIDILYQDNPLKKLKEVIVYLERLKLTTISYENLVSCDLKSQPIEMMSVNYIGNDYPFFTLNSEFKTGFYDFEEVIFEIEQQFKFYKLFNDDDLIRVYKNLNSDVTSSGEEYKYNEILRPVLQQYLFCCEYSAEPLSLVLTQTDVKNIGVDMKIFFMKVKKEAGYYILTDNDYKELMKLINSSGASEFYKEKLAQLVRDFRYNDSLEVDGRVCLKSVTDRLISILKESRGFIKNPELSYKVIEIITRTETSIFYEEDAIDDEYMNILISSLKANSAFKTLEKETQGYILSNVPDVRKSLLAFKKMKNIAFVI